MEAAQKADSRPLDDVMLAMDVVDTMRHQQFLVQRELNTEDRDLKMIERLRAVYASQGIEVPDHILEGGVTALKEDRFVYEPPNGGFENRLARLYVTRGKWGEPLLAGLGVMLIAWFAYVFCVSGPAEREHAALPGRLESQYEVLVEQAKGPAAVERAQSLMARGKSALGKGDTEGLQSVLAQMNDLQSEVGREYILRVVSRPGEKSGVWRIPDANPSGKNYYIIVEAVTADGNALELPVVNEEDGSTYRVNKWGLRVDKGIFERIAADKMDDGIIQQKRLGAKKPGYLKPEYDVPITGQAITSW